jgi:hypothetical protein
MEMLLARIRDLLVGTHSTASLIPLLGSRWGRSGMRPYQFYQRLANAPELERASECRVRSLKSGRMFQP